MLDEFVRRFPREKLTVLATLWQEMGTASDRRLAEILLAMPGIDDEMIRLFNALDAQSRHDLCFKVASSCQKIAAT